MFARYVNYKQSFNLLNLYENMLWLGVVPSFKMYLLPSNHDTDILLTSYISILCFLL